MRFGPQTPEIWVRISLWYDPKLNLITRLSRMRQSSVFVRPKQRYLICSRVLGWVERVQQKWGESWVSTRH